MLSLVKIDEHSRPDHPYLTEGDECYYIREYTPRQGPRYSSTNQLILNLKKAVDRKGQSDYHYKAEAIVQAAGELRQVINEEWLKQATLVPIPCSRAKDDSLYDARIIKLIKHMVKGLSADVRDLIVQGCNLDCFHGGSRLPPFELARYYSLNPKLCHPKPVAVGLIDDILTTGSHFKACKQVITERWPDIDVIGIFVARVYRIQEPEL